MMFIPFLRPLIRKPWRLYMALSALLSDIAAELMPVAIEGTAMSALTKLPLLVFFSSTTRRSLSLFCMSVLPSRLKVPVAVRTSPFLIASPPPIGVPISGLSVQSITTLSNSQPVIGHSMFRNSPKSSAGKSASDHGSGLYMSHPSPSPFIPSCTR